MNRLAALATDHVVSSSDSHTLASSQGLIPRTQLMRKLRQS
jgi:hypothetical protein